MIVNRISLENWSSFYGSHSIDLSIDIGKGKNVILFHGETGSGKTSITSAVQWLISGVTKMTKKVGDVRTSIIRKPVMWSERNFKGSLMNLEAFNQGAAKFRVEIEFMSDDNLYTVSRTCVPKSGLWSKQEQESLTELTLTDHGKMIEWKNDEAQKELNKIIPKRLLQFFVVEGDFIEKYTETLFGTSTSIEMNQSVNDAVGAEAIHRVTLALNTVLTQTSESIKNIKVKSNRENQLNDQYNYYVKRLREVRNEIESYQLDLEHKRLDHNRSKNTLEAFEGIRQTLEHKERVEAAIAAKKDSIPQVVNTISTNMEDGWRIILSPLFNETVSRKEELSKIKRNVNLNLAKKTIQHENLLASDEAVEAPACLICGAECVSCAQSNELIDNSKIESQLEELSQEIKLINDELSVFEQKFDDIISMEKNTISERRIKQSISDFNDLKKTLKSIKILEFQLDELRDLLIDVSDGDFKSALRRHDQLEKEIEEIEKNIQWRENDKDNDECIAALEKKIKSFGNIEIKSNTLKSQLSSAEARHQVVQLLITAFEETENRYLESKRLELNKMMTSTFRLMITDEEQKQTHDSLITEEDWSVTCLTTSGTPQPMENPGTQRKATLSYLEALRECSNVVFPIILDNPAAPLELPAKTALAEHFIGNCERQTILLTHSGGWELDHLLNKYSSSISKAYTLHGTKSGDMFRTSISKCGGE